MHNDGPVLAGFCFMYCELAGAVVTELFTDAFAVHVVEAVLQYATRIPVAPDAVAFGFAVRRSLPKTFACHFATHAVRVEATACLDMRIDMCGLLVVGPQFFVQKNVTFLNVAERCRVLADAFLEIVLVT